MSTNVVFCEECRDEVPYTIEQKELTGTIRGVQYHYVGEEAKCAHCGAYVDVEAISESNLKALYDVYRQENGIVSLEKIRAIPARYAIGKRPLSTLLGWGEHTFTRYADGDMPTKQYSETLSRLFDDPAYYLRILEENKDRLASQQTYEKSHKAVLALIDSNDTRKRKIDEVVAYLLNQCEDITPLALQKSLYYIQGFFYAFFKKYIFTENCEAWAHGPVYKDMYARYSNYRFDPITKVESFDSSIFTAQEKAILDSVIRNICCYSGKVLEAFTHNESPWINARGNLPDGTSSNAIIDKQMIGDYFLAVKKQYGMNSPRDIQLYTKDVFANL